HPTVKITIVDLLGISFVEISIIPPILIDISPD
ncbi:unnamed protein product, partial [marine sediment metagenome]